MNPIQKLQTIIDEQYSGDAEALKRAISMYDEKARQANNPARPPIDLSGAPTIIQLENVSRTYKLHRNNIVTALKDVSLTVKQGEFIAITGASGSGKSTLMHLIGGIDSPSSGSITVNKQVISRLSQGKLATYRLHTVGFVFQFFYLQPFLNVARNIEVPMMFAKTKRSERHSVVESTSGAVGLDDRLKHQPKQLSGGQIQRVAIARALVNKPKILLADEPTGNLDSKNGSMIMDLLHKIRHEQGTTIIVVTHDTSIAAQADRIVQLSDGMVV